MVKAGDCIYDSTEVTMAGDYDRKPVGTVYLPHRCDQWVIGGEDQVWDMIRDLQQVLVKIKNVHVA